MSDCVSAGDSVEKIADYYILRVFDLRLNGILIRLSFLLSLLYCFLFACEVNLLDFAMERELLL